MSIWGTTLCLCTNYTKMPCFEVISSSQAKKSLAQKLHDGLFHIHLVTSSSSPVAQEAKSVTVETLATPPVNKILARAPCTKTWARLPQGLGMTIVRRKEKMVSAQKSNNKSHV